LSAAQIGELGVCQGAPLAERQVAETQASYSDTDKLFHFVTNGVKHSPDLLIDPLTKHNPQSRRSDRMQPRDLGALAIQKNSAQKFLCVFAVPLSIQRHLVFLFDLEPWMSEPLCQIAIVCQQEQSFTLCVEPADIEQARKLWRQQIEDRVACIRIAPG